MTEAARRWLPSAVWLLVMIAAAHVLHAIIVPGELASIADDSSNYLVMAQCLSPWSAPGAAASVCAGQYFPPFFPLLLAVFGAARDVPLAHALVLAAFLAGLPLLWMHAARESDSRAAAHALVMCFVLLPGTLLGLQGVLSESLYLSLTALFLVLCGGSPGGASLRRCIVLGAVLGVIVSTRTVGMALVVAVVVQALVGRFLRGQPDVRASVWILCVAGVLVMAMRQVLPPADSPGDYAALWSGLLRNPPDLLAYLRQQSDGLVRAWASYIALYWSDERPLVWLGLSAVLVLCLAGLMLRLRANALDAWYLLVSLCVLLAWPFPGQMFRFLFPVMPLLLLQGVCLLVSAARRAPRLKTVMLLAPAIILAVAVPAHAFLLGRASVAHAMDMSPVYEWMRKPAADDAKRELGLQNAMLADFRSAALTLPGDAVVGFYEPSYIALLADRAAVGIPWPLNEAGWGGAVRAGATHLYLSRIHPRMSRPSVDGLVTDGPLPAGLERLWCSEDVILHQPAGCMYALRRPGDR